VDPKKKQHFRSNVLFVNKRRALAVHIFFLVYPRTFQKSKTTNAITIRAFQNIFVLSRQRRYTSR
jgi:hypothetical protein